MAINLVVLTGRLIKDVELKYSASGTAYARFTIAVNKQNKNDGANFISCTAFGKVAELIGEYTRKGNLIGIQGRLDQSEFEKDGKKEYKTGVMVDKVEFLESKKEETQEAPKKSNKVNPKPDMNLGEPKKEINFDDDPNEDFPF